MRGVLLLVIGACGRIDFAANVAVDQQQPDTLDCNVTQGLVAHWSLDAADINGSMILDRSPAAAHGTLVGTPLPVVAPARVGDGLDFAATNVAYAEMTVSLDTAPGAFNSVSLWFFHTDPNVDDALFYLPEAPGAQPPRYDLWLNYGRINEVTLCINSGVSDCWGVSDPKLLGRWVHVVAVLANGNTSDGRIYIDGVNANPSCRFGTCPQMRAAMNPFRLGGSDATYAFQGRLDDVRVYNRALDAAEAARLHACAN